MSTSTNFAELESLRAIVEISSDLIFVLDEHGAICDYMCPNPGHLYVPPEKFLGRKMCDILPDHLKDRFVGALSKTMTTSAPVSFEYWLDLAGGRKAFKSTHKFLTDSRKVLCVVQDISSQKELEDRLLAQQAELERQVKQRTLDLVESKAALEMEVIERKQNEEQFRILAESVDAIVTIHSGANLLFINACAERELGYSREEIQNLPFDIIVHPTMRDMLRERATRRLAGEDMPSEYEVIVLTKSGEERWLVVRPTVIRFQGKPAVMTTAYDVTRHKNLEEQLKRAKDLADQANKAKSEFLANMSHEMRTPLGAILGYAEIMKENHISEHERHDCLEVIDRNGNHLLQLIDAILDLSKIERGVTTVVKSWTNLQQELRNLERLFSIRHPDAPACKFAVNVATDAPDQIYTDPTRLRQILINLISNSVKFAAGGRVSIHVGWSDDSHSMLEFVIADDGIGIPMEYQRCIFEPFVQADLSYSRRYGGTGLGLPLSKKFASELGGDIELVRSSPNEGSVFRVLINPFYESSAGSGGTGGSIEPSTSSINKAPLTGFTVLLVEDSEDNQAIYKCFLEKAGATVEVASDGQAALDLATTRSYDIILMDMQLPIVDGYRATTILRQQGNSRPIIALTAHAMKGEFERCLEAGCNDYIAKPAQMEKLVSTVLKWLPGI